MAEITTLLWDVGGVLLGNGWDRAERSRAVERFALEQTVFYRPRAFSADDVRRFMFAQSEARPEALAIAEGLARARRYLMATVNNESLELNIYRIRRFGLRDHFSAFYSSCFLGVRKPSAAIFQRALDFTQRSAPECVMIDDRPENLEAPAALGMRTIRFQSAAQLREELARCGVGYTPSAGA
jgi:putative hydrolase of the HAD superfamily